MEKSGEDFTFTCRKTDICGRMQCSDSNPVLSITQRNTTKTGAILTGYTNFSLSLIHIYATAGRSIEPTQVEYRLRFTSTQEIPFPICPCLYPRMIVVRMGDVYKRQIYYNNIYISKPSQVYV